MMACVSPCFTVRSTPLRISFVALSASTETCRSRISSVAMGDSGLLGDGDEHIVPFDLYGVYGDGARRGKTGRLAGAEVERRSVQPALDRAVLHLALREGHVRVRADVVDREQLGLGLLDEPLLDVRQTDLLDQLGEEAAHDETAGLLGRDTAGLEVEQLLV